MKSILKNSDQNNDIFGSEFNQIILDGEGVLKSALKNLNFKDLESFEKIYPEDILGKICVSPPYFAFKEIYRSGELFISKLPVEQKITFESSSFSSAEASRHLAILASCAFGFSETEKYYYLSEEGRMSLRARVQEDNLYVVAIKLSSEKKSAKAITAVINDKNEIFYIFEIRFLKIKDKLFNKLFSSFVEETPKLNYNPYKNISSLINVKNYDNKVLANLPIIKIENCSGHFDNAPMMPIGILAYMIINQIGDFIKDKITKNNKSKIYLRSAEIILYVPSSIKREEPVEINYHGNSKDEHFFTWKVFSAEDGSLLNEMKISFLIFD